MFLSDINENAYEILTNLIKKQGLTNGKKLGYLNIFAKLVEQAGSGNEKFTMIKEDMLCW